MQPCFETFQTSEVVAKTVFGITLSTQTGGIMRSVYCKVLIILEGEREDFYEIALCLLLISFCSSENTTKFKYTMNTVFLKVCLHTVTDVRVFSDAVNAIFFA